MQATASSGRTHSVGDGDTACKIATAFGINIQNLANANGMTISGLDTIKAGQFLRIPAAGAATGGSC